MRAELRSSGILSDTDHAIYRQAFRLAADRNFGSALATGSTAGDDRLMPVLEWLRLRSDDGIQDPGEFASFLNSHADFPSLGRLLDRREEVAVEHLDDVAATAWFSQNPARTADGRVRHALLLKAAGNLNAARDLARTAWRDGQPSPAFEKLALAELSAMLAPADHWRRLDRLVWAGQQSAARRMRNLVPADAWRIADARLKLHYASRKAEQAYKALPASFRRDPGVLYERVRWLRRHDRDSEAQDLLVREASLLGGRRSVWIERRIQVRNLIKAGDFDKAYRIARDHGLTSGSSFAQGEFEAGWLALRFLNRPGDAFRHFQVLHDGVGFPISLSRGAYWSGRALLAQGNMAGAQSWFERASAHPTTFYGQLALHELGRERLSFHGAPSLSPASRTAFEDTGLPAIVRLLTDIGETGLSRLFLTHLIRTSDDAGIHPYAVALTLGLNDPSQRLIAGKLALQAGHPAWKAAYPVAEATSRQPHVAPALAHAIARQESAFNPLAVSSAGARGLMQLMPATAQRVADSTNLAYSRRRLTGDPAYNAHLGGAYLAQQVMRFDGYLPMAAAAYNAGPNRLPGWISDYGDPRAGVVDPVDWIELIPFSETRNYVQRVMEALQVYRIRLAGASEGELRLADDIGLKGTFTCDAARARTC